MKTRILLIASLLFAAFLLSPAISNANENADFTNSLSKTIKYPTKASENQLEGNIWLSITVDENGIMSIDESNYTCCSSLHDDVVKQIEGKKIKNFSSSMVGNHQLKMVFEIEK